MSPPLDLRHWLLLFAGLVLWLGLSGWVHAASCTTLWVGGTGATSSSAVGAMAACSADKAGNSGVTGSCVDVGGGFVAFNFQGVNPPYTAGRSCYPYTFNCSSTDPIGGKAYYDGGTNPAVFGINRLACIGGCAASWVGTYPQKSYLVAGVRHYLAYGQYEFGGSGGADGGSCSVGSGGYLAQTGGMSSASASNCPAGQYPGTVNGVTKCYTSVGAPVAETVAQPTQTVGNQVTTNGDGSKTVTTTTTNNQTNISTVSTTNYASGVTVPTLPTTTTGPIGSASGSGALFDPTSKDMGQFCTQNPKASACQDVSAGTGADTAGLYTADTSAKTFAGSINTFKASATSSGVASAAGSFFTLGNLSGACSGLSTTVTLYGGSTFAVDLSPYLCGPTAATFYSYLAAGLMLAALGIAFSIAIL